MEQSREETTGYERYTLATLRAPDTAPKAANRLRFGWFS
jgi:hypothetical protein